MNSDNRSQLYSFEKDIQLFHVYLEIFQNPSVGINKSKDQFYLRVKMIYQSYRRFQTLNRSGHTLRKCIQVINTMLLKLRCVCPKLRLNRSGASNKDIVNIFLL